MKPEKHYSKRIDVYYKKTCTSTTYEKSLSIAYEKQSRESICECKNHQYLHNKIYYFVLSYICNLSSDILSSYVLNAYNIHENIPLTLISLLTYNLNFFICLIVEHFSLKLIFF